MLAHIGDDVYSDKVKSARASLAAAEVWLPRAQRDFKRAKDCVAPFG
ncbi:MAG: hypothetical protein ABFS24_05350 [Pseudomonadota bacterium]